MPPDPRRRSSWLRLAAIAAALQGGALALPSLALALERDPPVRFPPLERGEVGGYVLYVTDLGSGVESGRDVGSVTMPAAVCPGAACDDANPCTRDGCERDGSCASEPVADGTACDDGREDTIEDQCFSGVCEGVLVSCATDADCDDGDVCNGVETCGGVLGCFEGFPLECGEPTACAAPGCSPDSGCFNDPLPDGTHCDDGDAATHSDACHAGACIGTPTPVPADLSLESLAPEVVAPGTRLLEVHGTGFVPGASLHFENGSGRTPRVRALEHVDPGLLRATVDVFGGGPRRARFFDARLTLADGRSALLPDALRIQP